MTARRIQHVSVPTPDDRLEACRAFYEHALGMRPIPNLAGIAWFELGDGDHVHLLSGEGLATHRSHFALEVDDLGSTLARCRAVGCEPAAQRPLWGAPRWWVRDPAGNLVELFDRSPPVSRPSPAG